MRRLALLSILLGVSCGSTVFLFALGACGTHQHNVRRALVTDNLKPGSSRAEVRRWLEDHDWCPGRIFETTDEYVICGPRPYMDPRTPGARTMLRYPNDRLDRVALFVPIPRTRHPQPVVGYEQRKSTHAEHGLIDDKGLVDNLAEAGFAAWESPPEVRSTARTMLDALAEELRARYGEPDQINATRTAMMWKRPTERIALFLAASGDWVVETHEFGSR